MKETIYRIQEVETGWAVIKNVVDDYNGKTDEEFMRICDTENQAINLANDLAKVTGNRAIVPEKKLTRPLYSTNISDSKDEMPANVSFHSDDSNYVHPVSVNDARREMINEMMGRGWSFESATEFAMENIK